jgi:predicted DNA-binding antitoxin AbrB/MazE fold protein
MKTTTYEAIVENGQIKLPESVHLPEHTKVLVVVPNGEPIPASRIYSPRLAHPEQASDFIKEVVKES